MLARGRGGALPVLRVRMAALVAKAPVAGRGPAMELRAAARQYLGPGAPLGAFGKGLRRDGWVARRGSLVTHWPQ